MAEACLESRWLRPPRVCCSSLLIEVVSPARARLGTLRQSEEIIVPVSIRAGSQVLPATIAWIHDTYVGPVSRRIDDEEGVRPVFDAGNYVLCGPLPTASTNMGDPVLGTIPIWLRHAGDLNVWHVVLQEGSPNSGFLTRRGGVTSTALPLRRPGFSWTRIKGESDVKGGGRHGWVEASAGSGVGADGAAVGAGALAPGQRWSASRKRDVVLRLLRGESLEMVSREVGVELYCLEAWQARALAGLELGLKA